MLTMALLLPGVVLGDSEGVPDRFNGIIDIDCISVRPPNHLLVPLETGEYPHHLSVGLLQARQRPVATFLPRLGQALWGSQRLLYVR
jgi:hypothetical protein